MQSCSYVLYLPTRLLSACVATAVFTSYMHLWHASKAFIQHFRPLQLPEGGIGKATAPNGQTKAEASSKVLPYALWGPTRHTKSKRSVVFLACFVVTPHCLHLLLDFCACTDSSSTVEGSATIRWSLTLSTPCMCSKHNNCLFCLWQHHHVGDTKVLLCCVLTIPAFVYAATA